MGVPELVAPSRLILAREPTHGDKVMIQIVQDCLGIVFDNKLSFKNHIMFLENKVARSVGMIAKLSYYLPCKSLMTPNYSLVHTNILYVIHHHHFQFQSGIFLVPEG